MTGVCLVDGQDDRCLLSGLGKKTGVCLADWVRRQVFV